MQPDPNQTPTMQDSVVGGNMHTGNVVHNHYHSAPQQAVQPVIQQMVQPVVQQIPVQTIVQPHASALVPQTGSKDVVVAYLLWFFVGWLGVHRFYLGHNGIGVLYLLTFAGFGIGWVIDALIMPQLVQQANTSNQIIIMR